MMELVTCRVVQAEIKRDTPLTVYAHCAGYRLNLVIHVSLLLKYIT